MEYHEINELKEKAAKWDALNDEIDKFYLNESGIWSEKDSIKKHDFAEIGLMVAKFVDWEDEEIELNNKQ